MRHFSAALLLSVALLLAFSERTFSAPGEWKSYTSKRNVRAVMIDSSGAIWAATSGGLFVHRPGAAGASAYRDFTTSEGLQTTDLSALTIDRNGKVWIGAENGLLQRFDPKSNSWLYVTDISSLTNPGKSINDLVVHGDTLFVLSQVGISVYSLTRNEFGDTYGRFGAGPNPIVGNVLSLQEFGGRLWAATAKGIVSTSLDNPNPSAPESWSVSDTGAGLPASAVTGLTIASDTLYAATSRGLAFFNGTRWNLVPGTGSLNILHLSTGRVQTGETTAIPPSIIYGEFPVFNTSTEVWVGPGSALAAGSGDGSAHSVLVNGSDFSAVGGGSLYQVVGSSSNGLLISASAVPQLNQWNPFVPSGPYSSTFIGIAVDNDGTVWSGTGIGAGVGAMSFDGTTWRSYRADNYPQIGSNSCFNVSIGPDNSKWLCYWDAGVAILDARGNVRRVLGTNNGLFHTLAPDTGTFVVVGGVATDRNGNAWIANRTPPGDTAVVVFHPDSTISYATGWVTRYHDPNSYVLNNIVIDQYNTKWFTNFSRFESQVAKGLLFYNEDGPLTGTSGNWALLTTDNGLTSDQVWSLALGKDGDLWVGSDQGISIIFDPQVPGNVALYHPLREQVIQAIAVDALNNKWIGTRNGVFVLSADGTTILDRYTFENTNGKLLDNDITSIAIDGKSGIVYFGTEKGLSSLHTPGVTPEQSFTELKIYPNPFFLPAAQDLTVDGLVQGTTLKVMTVSGSLVREIRTAGGRVGYWDGKNDRGEYVPSGIYIIAAASEDGKQVTTGKVGVLRR